MLLTPLSVGKMMLLSACFKSPFSRAASAGAIAYNIGQIGQGLSVGYFVGGELRALLSAFANDSNINVLLEIHYTPKHGSWLDMAEIVVASRLDNALTDVYRIKSR